MALRNVALLITNDNRQGIMETIIVLLALLSQILGLFGFVFSCLLFLRFGKVKKVGSIRRQVRRLYPHSASVLSAH